jgi:thiamine biosynthesis lipoprotein
MGGLFVAWVAVASLGMAPPPAAHSVRFEFERTEMAIPFKLVLYAPDESTANGAAETVFRRIHQLNAILSDYDPDSELRRLCDTAGEGKAVPVSEDLWRVLVQARTMAERTDGAFDPTIGPVIRVWRLARAFQKMPPQELLDRTRSLVDYRLMRLAPKDRTVELTKRGMRLDLGGIAKGFAVQEGLAILRSRGIEQAMIQAGGDLGLAAPPPDRPGWTIGIAPQDAKGPPSFYLCLSRTFVASSGDMYQYVVLDGKRYSHIVDPKTGLGLTDHSQVTVVGPDGMTADAMATAVSVLGPDRGLKLVDETPGMAAYFQRRVNGRIEARQSARWKELPRIEPDVAVKGECPNTHGVVRENGATPVGPPGRHESPSIPPDRRDAVGAP